MTDDDLIEAIREQAGWGMSRHVARKILAVVAPEIGRRAAEVAKCACLVPPDGGSPTEEEWRVGEEAARRILATFPATETRPDTDPLRETF